jgi:DNA repair exonuclease SbcCD ATPase subunit
MKLKLKENANILVGVTDSEDDTPLIVKWVSRPANNNPRASSRSFDKIKEQKADTPAAVAKSQPTISIGNETLLANYDKRQVLLEDEKERAVELKSDLATHIAKTTIAQEDSETQKKRGDRLQAELERLQRDHIIELRKVQQNRDEEVKQAVNEALQKAEAEQREQDLETLKESCHLRTELLQVTKERDELRRSLAVEKTRSASEETERQKVSALTSKFNILQAETATLKTYLEREKKYHTKTNHELDAQLHLAHELASQKHMESLKREVDSRSTFSLTPTASSAQETKVENIRKTYIRVKMRYDILFSVAKDIHTSTNGMNLANFGEFGGYLKQLRTAIEEVNQEGGGDSQRSRDPGYAESIGSIP